MVKRSEVSETELLERLIEDSKWISENYEELRKYEGKVIAVKNKRIILASESILDLLNELEKKENAAYILVEAIPPKNASFIL